MRADDRITRFLNRAIGVATDNVVSAHGGPFGAVIAKEDELIATGANRVTANNDPTAHAEIMAMRTACGELDSFSLEGCVLYASCEPCPMCLAAAYWARIDAIWYAATKEDAERAGFADVRISRELALPPEKRILSATNCPLEQRCVPFEKWLQSEKRIPY